jgi:2-keto-4-pentenoate hydratase/2-oxohepta-3-ene-1,7-dioic acid hydratase in catechol pathway
MPAYVHVVVLKLKDDATAEQKATIVDGLRALPAQIPEIQTYRAGLDLGLDPSGCHIGIVGTFESPEAYAVYAKHEAHVGLIQALIKPVLAKRAAVQFTRLRLADPPRRHPGGTTPPALTHCVLLKLKEDATPEQRQAILDGLGSLPPTIAQIQAYRVGPDAGLDPAKFDVAIVGDFNSVDDYREYAKHEAHVGVITSKIKPFLAERVAVQFSATDSPSDGPATKRSREAQPARFIRFVDADSGEVCYGEPQDDAFSTALVLKGDPLQQVPFERSDRVAKVGRLLTPILAPNILCIGLNYMRHYEEGAKKRGIALPTKPVTFMKTNNTLTAHGGEVWRPNMVGEDDALNPEPDEQSNGNNAGALDFEVELCIVIGKPCRNATAENALDHVLGYTVSNDISSRHWQRFCNQWVKGKSFDTFCPVGPAIVSPEVTGDPDKLRITSRLNGETMQDSNTSDQIFSCTELICWLSKDMTLVPGTIILTGTPEGIGAAMKPPRFMVPGDVIECEIENLGVLSNKIVQAPLDGVCPVPQ